MRDPNESGELTAESRAARGTAEVVEMIDPSGNRCSVSVRHQKDGGTKVIDEKLAAGWVFADLQPEQPTAAVEPELVVAATAAPASDA
jgi:hypothetical protein